MSVSWCLIQSSNPLLLLYARGWVSPERWGWQQELNGWLLAVCVGQGRNRILRAAPDMFLPKLSFVYSLWFKMVIRVHWTGALKTLPAPPSCTTKGLRDEAEARWIWGEMQSWMENYEASWIWQSSEDISNSHHSLFSGLELVLGWTRCTVQDFILSFQNRTYRSQP